MSGLAKFLEDEGLATTLVALVREQAERVAPPRALWVSFPLGRPFGVPGDAAFQTRVLRAALALLDRAEGPVLEDFPEDEPDRAADGDGEGWVCPVRFPKATATGDGGPLDAALAEIRELAPWYEASLNRRGRTTVGASGLAPAEAARLLARWADGATPEGTNPFDALRLAAEDLKAYYMEAATARPGTGAHEGVADWFWTETAAAGVLQALRETCLASDDRALRDLGDIMLAPEERRA